ncbi:MAG TPA: TolC family protein [Candidatus Avimuribaculum pullicola]|nr:TolC family protein [Candidatus Avimuribaculum pullicola]
MDLTKIGYVIMIASLTASDGGAVAQQVWSVDSCMEYAVEHNRTVRQRVYEADNYKIDRLTAIGNFLPGINASSSLQYNWGRSIDPETNTYNSISTFNNSYSLEMSLTVFSGGSIVNNLRQSKAAQLMGKAALQVARDNTALETFQAYIDALYYYGSVRLAREKVAESGELLRLTQRQEELGLKGLADVAQIEAQHATDDYTLTNQTNLYESAMLTLKQKMNYPMDKPLQLDTTLLDKQAVDLAMLPGDTQQEVLSTALMSNPTLLQSHYSSEVSRFDMKKSWANVMPTISVYAGISSSYYKELGAHTYADYWTQMKNNFGQYVGMSISIPLFSGFERVNSVRKARNSYRIAQEQYEAQKEELQKLVAQAVLDRNGFLKESIQMEKKVKSDAVAYAVTRRKFEEGLMTSLDVQTSASTLLESRVGLLRSKLSFVLKCRLVDYYKGKEIIKKNNGYTD